jgi:hypothetical protein
MKKTKRQKAFNSHTRTRQRSKRKSITGGNHTTNQFLLDEPVQNNLILEGDFPIQQAIYTLYVSSSNKSEFHIHVTLIDESDQCYIGTLVMTPESTIPFMKEIGFIASTYEPVLRQFVSGISNCHVKLNKFDPDSETIQIKSYFLNGQALGTLTMSQVHGPIHKDIFNACAILYNMNLEWYAHIPLCLCNKPRSTASQYHSEKNSLGTMLQQRMPSNMKRKRL